MHVVLAFSIVGTLQSDLSTASIGVPVTWFNRRADGSRHSWQNATSQHRFSKIIVQADIAELKRRIEVVSKASPLGARVKKVEVEADEYAEGGPFLRVFLQIEHPDDLDWPEVEPLVRSIEDAVAAIDERFPSVRFADAA